MEDTSKRFLNMEVNAPMLILCSPTVDSKLQSISGMDVNPNHSWSEGEGFMCKRIVPLSDETLTDSDRGTFKWEATVQFHTLHPSKDMNFKYLYNLYSEEFFTLDMHHLEQKPQDTE